jgi:hypothetical protein
MPDRMYALEPGRTLDYDVAFKRRPPDLHAVRSSDPAVHRCRVRVSMPEPGTLSVSAGGAETREVPLGDTLLAVYEAVRELAAEDAPDDLGDCALIFTLRE